MAWIAGARYHPRASASVPLILMEAACPFRSSMVQALTEADIPWHAAFETSTLAGVRAEILLIMTDAFRTEGKLAEQPEWRRFKETLLSAYRAVDPQEQIQPGPVEREHFRVAGAAAK